MEDAEVSGGHPFFCCCFLPRRAPPPSMGRLKPGHLAHIISSASWSARTSRCTSPPSKRECERSCYTGDCPRSGPRSSMNGSVFPRCYMLPYPPCRGFVVLSGDVNGAAEFDLDAVRDREPSCVVYALGDYRVATAQRDCDTRQQWPSATRQHIRWGRCTALPAQCQVTPWDGHTTVASSAWFSDPLLTVRHRAKRLL